MDKEDFRKLLVQWASEDVYINQLTWEEGDALAEYLAKWYAAQQSVQRIGGMSIADEVVCQMAENLIKFVDGDPANR